MTPLLRRASAAVLMVLATTASANAQLFDYYTHGAFSGGFGCSDSGATASCVFGSLTLTFNGFDDPDVYSGPASVDLGTFTVTGTGIETVDFGDLTFTLWIYQTVPTVLDDGVGGSIAGTIQRGPNSGQLVWRPDFTRITLPPTIYDIILDNTNQDGFVIPAGGSGILRANVTVTPEPASMALMATGLIGVIGLARRRRQKDLEA